MDLRLKVKDFPESPGVYLMKDAQGRVIYVGKANNLKKRVQSYFREKDERHQVRFLMNRVADIETVVTETEKEAFLLENTLIKKHRPRYNIQLKDDKNYASIRLSMKDRFPRVTITRTIRKDGSLYFGPYTSATAARETVEFIERHFRLRTCSDREFANRVRPCLQHQIHRCDAPCVGLIDETGYRQIADQVRLFLQGKKGDLLEALEKEMRRQAEAEAFEKAARTRDLTLSIRETLEKQTVARHDWKDRDVVAYHREGERITFCILPVREGKVSDSLLYHLKGQGEDSDLVESFLGQFYREERHLPDEILLSQPIANAEVLRQILSERRGKPVAILAPQKGIKSDLTHLAEKNAQEGFRRRAGKTEEMREILDGLQETLGLMNFPQQIECFDISNLAGQEAVGSLVCFVEGMPNKEGYRRFKIKTVEGPNDFAMMKEILKRRLLRTEWQRPDLIVVDGGKGQLGVVLAVLGELNITGIDLIALAKEKEGEDQDKVFLPGRKNPVLLGRRSSLLHLLMRIRDEAHRFAISYHRKLRERKMMTSLPKVGMAHRGKSTS